MEELERVGLALHLDISCSTFLEATSVSLRDIHGMTCLISELVSPVQYARYALVVDVSAR